MRHARTRRRVLADLAPGPTEKAPKQQSKILMLRVKTLSAQDRHWRVSREKNYGDWLRVRQDKRARVGPLTA